MTWHTQHFSHVDVDALHALTARHSKTASTGTMNTVPNRRAHANTHKQSSSGSASVGVDAMHALTAGHKHNKRRMKEQQAGRQTHAAATH
jgi:hypothetical protein